MDEELKGLLGAVVSAIEEIKDTVLTLSKHHMELMREIERQSNKIRQLEKDGRGAGHYTVEAQGDAGGEVGGQ